MEKECECYEEEVQPYRKTDYTPIIYINMAILCARIESRTDFSHISEMVEDKKVRSGLYPFFQIVLLNVFGSFALCMSDRLFQSVHCSTDSPSLFVVVYPQSR